MSTQSCLNLSAKKSGPVECLGQSFPSDHARREHYLSLLAEKLKDTEFRKIEGFPIGEDEDILALSDPPYYTACPNPWIGDFIQHYGRPYDPKEKYHREPFAADVSEGKGHAIYNAHSYHTKVPHRAIMRYILHYTNPGDVVFDGFCGTGMTGVAAQLCGDRKEVQELGYRVDDKGQVYDESGNKFSIIGARRCVLNDLSPAASFISSLYNMPCDASLFREEAERILQEVYDECSWMFQSDKSGKIEDAEYYVWSDVFTCGECGTEFAFWDIAVDEENAKVHTNFQCPSCSADLTKRKINRVFVSEFDASLGKVTKTAKRKLVIVSGKGSHGRGERKPAKYDEDLVSKISKAPSESFGWHPSSKLEKGDKTSDPYNVGIYHAHEFFTPRNLRVLSSFYKRARASSFFPRILALMTGGLLGVTLMQRFRPKTTFPNMILSGTLYVGSLVREWNAIKWLRGKLGTLEKAFLNLEYNSIITVGSATSIKIPSNSLDYFFLDPPFGSNLMYSELNFLWESWLKVATNKNPEAIENKTQKKGMAEYHELMAQAFAEAYRILKPGRWMTVEFSNTQASVWNSIQTALQRSGFIVANVAALDKEQLSFNALNNPTSVKQDLVISAYKPSEGLEDSFRKSSHTIDGVWHFIRTHLSNLPVVKPRGGELEFIVERDPRILYDRMIAFYICHGVPVPLSSAEFQAALAEKFPEREGMFFLPEQVTEWDKKRVQMQGVGQMSIFVEDEKSAIDWLRNHLKSRPSTYQDIQPEFMQQLGASWKKFETRPELSLLLEQNFLKYDGKIEVPSQIHSYLSTQNKDLRNLLKDDARLQARAKDRWFVPDPAKAVDVEAIRNKRLLQEFWELCTEADIARPSGPTAQRTLPLLTPTSAKKTGRKKLKEVRTEAVRLGFKECFAAKDYTTILAIAAHLPENVIEEDEQLQMMHDMAEMRAQG
jgi:DNA modification methylase